MQIISTILLASFGEWIEANLFSIVSLLLIAIGAIIWLIRLESSVKQVCEKMDELEDCIEQNSVDFNAHTKDTNAHVNHLYMQSLKERLIKLESAVESVNKNLGDKLDRMTEKMFGR